MSSIKTLLSTFCDWAVAAQSEEHVLKVGDLVRQLELANDRIATLERAAEEALGWNWLDDDAPEDVRARIVSVIDPDGSKGIE